MMPRQPLQRTIRLLISDCVPMSLKRPKLHFQINYYSLMWRWPSVDIKEAGPAGLM